MTDMTGTGWRADRAEHRGPALVRVGRNVSIAWTWTPATGADRQMDVLLWSTDRSFCDSQDGGWTSDTPSECDDTF